MSDTDSFIDEVTEEVRRDHLFVMLKRYGWIGGVAVAMIVGGTAYREYSGAQERAAAETLGDSLISALAIEEAAPRAEQLATIATETAGSAFLVQLTQASALADVGETAKAVALLDGVATNGDLELVYRHLAAFKALTLQSDSLSVDDRRLRFEALAQPGAPFGLLASEQLALLDVEAGNQTAAIDRLRAIAEDAGVRADQKERVTQLVTALGGNIIADNQGDG